MLTRVEIDGFKSFENFELALPPFAVILGPNASGKSNLFDALRLLSRLAVMDVRSAMRELRGEPNELFRHLPDGSIAPRMRFAVETLLEARVKDDYGQELSLNCTRIRYEITIVRRVVNGIERFFVERERALPIRKDRDHWRPYEQMPSADFRKNFIKYTSRTTPFLETADEGQAEFQLHQDTKQGRKRHLPAVEAERSVLSTVTIAREFPHLYALQKELEDLRYLQLDPAAERRSSPLDAPERLEQDGANLAAVLYRIEQETRSSEQPRGALTDILADLAEIVPGVVDLQVERDDERREYRLRVAMRDGQMFSSRVVSDGTLRVLALLALLRDPQHRGVLCFEEPENGVHKSRLERLMEFLQESCAQPAAKEVEPDGSLLQIIVNTHSMVAARAVKKTIILAEMVEIVGGGAEEPRRCTRMTPYCLNEQGELPLGEEARRATIMKVEQLLEEHERRSLAA
jgi:predicted ATPase